MSSEEMSLLCSDVCAVIKSTRISVHCKWHEKTMYMPCTGRCLQYVKCLFHGEHAAYKAVNAEPILVNAFNVLPVYFGPGYVRVCGKNAFEDGLFHLYQPLLRAGHGPRTEQQVVQRRNHELVRRSGLRAQRRLVLTASDRRARAQLHSHTHRLRTDVSNRNKHTSKSGTRPAA